LIRLSRAFSNAPMWITSMCAARRRAATRFAWNVELQIFMNRRLPHVSGPVPKVVFSSKNQAILRQKHPVLEQNGTAGWLLNVSGEIEGRGNAAERFDAEGDVLVERNTQFFCAFVDIVAADTAGEGFILQFFLHRGGFHFVDTF